MPKVVSDFNDSHLARMFGYPDIAGLQTALLLDFKHAKLGIKRISGQSNPSQSPIRG
jgi:hypothetical protein